MHNSEYASLSALMSPCVSNAEMCIHNTDISHSFVEAALCASITRVAQEVLLYSSTSAKRHSCGIPAILDCFSCFPLLHDLCTMGLGAGKFYRWICSVFVFLPQAFDEDDSDESSESNQYVAEGQRVVNRALQQRADGSEVSALLNLAHYVSSDTSASGAWVRGSYMHQPLSAYALPSHSLCTAIP